MGTYPIGHTSTVKPRRAYKGIGGATMAAYLEGLIADPKISLARLAKKHKLGISTTANWFNVFPSKIKGRRPQQNNRVTAWLKEFTNEKNNLARLLKARPRHRIHPLILQEVADAVALHDGEPFNSDNQRQFVDTTPTDVGHERRVGPTGIDTFVPITTDDLLVVKEEVLKVKAEAEVVVLEATVLALAIETVRDWLTDKDRLQLALGRIHSLEAQLKAADAIQKRFQEKVLASNQVHSRD